MQSLFLYPIYGRRDMQAIDGQQDVYIGVCGK